ncbi:MAG: UbiD family decarboxylase associated with menaquinone via futalosine [Olavius algarvensis Delta 4 endosymbiont]|nr:MAG: UbiD family decarboxylase associated with menaquinone via futalosine [Olavius algarvensis Delta 4 endosymbiont]
MKTAYSNLDNFLKALKASGELKIITAPVSPYLDISRYTDSESKQPDGGQALYFQNVTGYHFPVATNIFGSPRRICLALGVSHLDELADRVREYIDFNPPGSLKEALNTIPMAITATKFIPRAFKGKLAPCQEVVHTGSDVDLNRLPVLHCWPKDGGPFVTLPLVFTRSLKTGKRNVGMYRLQIFDQNTTGMHWHIHKDGSHYYSEYVAANQRMPVSVAIGADPATTYAATAPLPRGIDEMLLAGFIRKKPVRMVKCLTNDLEVPAEAEFVLEGYVDPGEMRLEGPFGDHTGYYSLADDYPVFHVTAVTHRKNPVYSATLVGPPPMEDCYLAKATERLFLPMLQTVFPEIVDYWFPWEGVFHNIVIIALDKGYACHAPRIMSGLWGQGQMSFCKAIVIVDKSVNPQDPGAVLAELVSKLDLETDVTLSKGVLDVLDHSSPNVNFGNKIGIDLTTRVGDEPPRQLQRSADPAPEGEELMTAARQSCPAVTGCRPLLADRVDPRGGHRVLAVTIDKTDRGSGQDIAAALLASPALAAYTLILMFDAGIDLGNPSLLLWKLFNNTDPGRDLLMRDSRAAIDASVKGTADGHNREWPEELTLDV